MTTLYQKMFKEKKKKSYDGPPRPNLMSQAKELKGIQEKFDFMQTVMQQQQAEINQLKSKLNQSNYRVEMLTTYLKNNRNAK